MAKTGGKLAKAPAIARAWPLRDKVAFVGIGTTRYGNFPDTDSYGLGCEALNAALEDAGLKCADIDGLIVNRIPTYERFAEMMGINPKYCLLTEMPGRFSGVSLALGAQAIATGEAEIVALVYGNNGRSVRMHYGGGDSQWSPWGMTSPGAIHAMMWRRHMHEFGTTHADLGPIALAFRRHACLNPAAVMHGRPITLADHAAARPVCEPLRLLDQRRRGRMDHDERRACARHVPRAGAALGICAAGCVPLRQRAGR